MRIDRVTLIYQLKIFIMKKITLLIAVIFCTTGFAQFTENFDSNLNIPIGWTVINGGDDNAWEILDTDDEFGVAAHSGNNAAGIFYDVDIEHDDYLITPAITVTAGVSDYFSFWGRSLDPDYPEQIMLKISTTGVDATDFTVNLADIVAPSSGLDYHKFAYDLTPFIGQTIYIAFYSSTVDKFVFEVDDVVNGALPSCLEPNSFIVNAVTSTAAELSWSSTGTLFKIEYGPEDFTPGTGTVVSTAESPYTIDDLEPGMIYDVYLQNNCGNGDLSEPMALSIITLPTPAVNDTCTTAAPLTVTNSLDTGEIFTSVAATTDSETVPDCADFYANDVWFSIVVPEDGNVTVETQQVVGSDNDDTIIQAFSGTCGALTSIDCNDDNEDAEEGYFSKLVLTGLTPGETIYVAVWQFSLEEFGFPATPGQFSISAYNETLSVSNNNLAGLKYFPNPVKSVLNLSYKHDIKDINVFNMIGQRVFSQALNSTDAEVDLSSLATGTYTVKLTSGNDVKTLKIIKQ